MSANQLQDSHTGGLWDVPQSSEYLSISERKLYELMAEKHLKFVKIGRSVRLRKQDMDEFIESHLVG